MKEAAPPGVDRKPILLLLLMLLLPLNLMAAVPSPLEPEAMFCRRREAGCQENHSNAGANSFGAFHLPPTDAPLVGG